MTSVQTNLEIRPLTPAIGAEVRGFDMRNLDDESMRRIEEALYQHLVLFFRDQDVTPEQHLEFARWFGPLDNEYKTGHPDHPDLHVLDESQPVGHGTNDWHTDTSGKATPARIAVLRAVQIPPFGGDTCWSSMEAALERISPPLRTFLEGLTALHDPTRPIEHAMNSGRTPMAQLVEARGRLEPVEHPVVIRHPVTGRPCLYVNHNYTTRIRQLTREESDSLLRFLFDHVARPDFQVRFRWERNSVAVWDLRATQHYAVADYAGHQRIMHRVSVAGDRPSADG